MYMAAGQLVVINKLHKNTENKSTKGAQASLAKAAHYPHIAQIPDLESQHGNLDEPKNVIVFPYIIVSDLFMYLVSCIHVSCIMYPCIHVS